MSNTCSLYTQHPMEECVARLNGLLSSAWKTSRVIGWTEGERFRLKVTGRASIVVLDGTFSRCDQGTLIEMIFTMPLSFRLVSGFTFTILCSLILVFTRQWCDSVLDHIVLPRDQAELGIRIAGVVLIAVAWYSLNWYANKAILVYFLKTNLEAHSDIQIGKHAPAVQGYFRD